MVLAIDQVYKELCDLSDRLEKADRFFAEHKEDHPLFKKAEARLAALTKRLGELTDHLEAIGWRWDDEKKEIVTKDGKPTRKWVWSKARKNDVLQKWAP